MFIDFQVLQAQKKSGMVEVRPTADARKSKFVEAKSCLHPTFWYAETMTEVSTSVKKGNS
jgi:hypothetical protein